MRKMTWALIAWGALILIWIVAGAENANCDEKARQLNQEACEVGAGLGVAVILFFGFCGFVVLSIIWFMTRPKETPAPIVQQPAAGWYPDPAQPGQQRYWNGATWTEHRAPMGGT